MESSAQFARIIAALQHTRIVNNVHLAAATILALDYFLTFEIEVSLIWGSSWNWTKVLFILTRYLPFIDVPIALYHQFAPGMFLSSVILAEVILTIRTWALWGKDWRLSVILPIFFCGCFVPVFILLNVFLNSLTFTPLPIPGTVGCFVTGANPILSVCYILLMVYETGILFLMVIRGLAAYKQGGDSKLARVVYRDERVLHSVLTSRVILHIREQARSMTLYKDGRLNESVLGSAQQQIGNRISSMSSMKGPNSPGLPR
ncbi:hypothetical protein AMATHDRAFT_6910 [Amanita thiersii Skay4041]|uniref:DUF6533 domain-containing protein n=1 Tax=Amanita thiersii Skay4041 TaxID=703135 RepID=A0A2A9NDB7_9AGAR|nr:hypothetical protein AMATHDRAFT_6910 [Amanita thiersii Skay4041]